MGNYDEWYALWASDANAARMLDHAVSYYIDVNQGTATSMPADLKHYVLDRDDDPVKQLGSLYSRLRVNCPDGGKAMLKATQECFDTARTASPPKYFHSWIYGLFLLTKAPEEFKPHPGRFLQFLRPLIELGEDRHRERDLYFSAIHVIGEASSLSPEKQRQAGIAALTSEWEYSQSQGLAPASLARLLCREQPDQWPAYIAAVCENKWPTSSTTPRTSKFEFAYAAQNIIGDVDPAIVVSELSRLAEFLDQNKDRGEYLMESIFVATDATDYTPDYPLRSASEWTPHDTAPFVLFKPEGEPQPKGLTDWKIARRGIQPAL